MMELNIVLMPQDTHSDIKISNSTIFFFFFNKNHILYSLLNSANYKEKYINLY